MFEPIYSNTIARYVSKSAQRDEKTNCVDKRVAICMVVLLSVVLFLSLLANAALANLYFYNGLDVPMSCEPVTNYSYSDVEQNAQIKQIFLENRSQAHHCPKKDFPEKWVSKQGRVYVFITEKKDWSDSRRCCQDLGGDLVIINHKAEQNILAKQLGTIGGGMLYWIGLTDGQTEGVWLWVDDSKLLNSFWDPPPDDHKSPENPQGEDCVVLKGHVGAKWGDVSCSRKERSICEIPCS